MWCLSAMVGEQFRNAGIGIQPLTLEKSLLSSYCLTNDRGLLNEVPKQVCGEEFFQVIPAKLVLDWRQLELPALLTFESFIKSFNISRKIWLQYLLYFCATRQIRECLNKLRDFLQPPYIVVKYSLKKGFLRRKDYCINRSGGKLLECSNELSKESVGLFTDLRSVLRFYNLGEVSFQKSVSKDYLLRRALTKIAYLKVETT